jgi:hypothetical protein
VSFFGTNCERFGTKQKIMLQVIRGAGHSGQWPENFRYFTGLSTLHFVQLKPCHQFRVVFTMERFIFFGEHPNQFGFGEMLNIFW